MFAAIRPCLPQEPAGIGQHLCVAQGRRQAEGSAAHSPTREPRIRTLRHLRHLHHALQRRHQDPRRIPHLPWPPSPLPWKAWKTGWSLIQDVTRPQRSASRTATQPRLPCLRSQGTSTTSEDLKFVVYRSTIDT